MTERLRFTDVEVDGRLVEVDVVSGTIARVGPRDARSSPASATIDGRGGALIPGLHDHHIHLAALAAEQSSTYVGPLHAGSVEDLQRMLTETDGRLGPGVWLRAVGYHESTAGDLDRDLLDRLVPDRPTRVQHRSGVRWILNSAGLRAIGADETAPAGVGRDSTGRLTGTIDREDDWLRSRLPEHEFPDLAPVGRVLAEAGVTGVTDCTPHRTVGDRSALVDAVVAGFPVRTIVTGHVDLLGAPAPGPVELGPVKVIIDEFDLPGLDDLVEVIKRSHAESRCVAVHLVTEAATAFALAAWMEAGARRGDRIEHGSVLTVAMLPEISRLGLAVVTQPGFVADRGDAYRREMLPEQHGDLYRCRSLLDYGIPVAGSTDAPYTDPDPWRAIAAAVARTTPSGAVLGPTERISSRAALALFTGDPLQPGGPERRVEVGAPADLCLLHAPLDEGLARPDRSAVRSTFVGGHQVAGTEACE